MKHAYFFSFWNPSCRYELNLSNPIERDIAITLIVMNKQVIKRITQGELVDRSQVGNKSCFRNEKHNGMSFVMDPDYQLPETGLFECDFVYLADRPYPDT